MITKNCVFVIGAGASHVYGFSLGTELKNSVINLLASPGKLLPLKFDKNQIDSFRESLIRSGSPSVDAFLEKRSDFVNIGKFVMSKIIADQENIGRLFDNGQWGQASNIPHDYRINGDWLIYLNSLMETDFENFRNNNVQFITYNYDRVIETYFFETLKNSFGKSDEEVAQVVNSFKIIHVHGQLGYLPWQIAEETKKRAFGTSGKTREELIKDIEIAASEIKIIHEADSDSPEYIKAREILKNAKSILFLGFGYSPRNIERLKLDTQRKNVWGTFKGFTRAEIEGVNRKYFSARQIKHPLLIESGCLELLRELDRSTFND
jgi:hypothetical protein